MRNGSGSGSDPIKILLVHGPNLDQLGRRDPVHYGTLELDGLLEVAQEEARACGAELDHAQHDFEGALVSRLHAAHRDGTDAVIVNAGALTHYSYALRDALEMLTIPKIELHLSNVHGRERFRQRSVLAAACDAAIAGLGPVGYRLAVRAAVALVEAGDRAGERGSKTATEAAETSDGRP
ncbi:MAG: type II 3-dehydroquinate dehydratase [Actinomycetota bacterium]|nr:type II 3-dehydroquinate dehydratase [Actinomycetota bacterium]